MKQTRFPILAAVLMTAVVGTYLLSGGSSDKDTDPLVINHHNNSQSAEPRVENPQSTGPGAAALVAQQVSARPKLSQLAVPLEPQVMEEKTAQAQVIREELDGMIQEYDVTLSDGDGSTRKQIKLAMQEKLTAYNEAVLPVVLEMMRQRNETLTGPRVTPSTHTAD